MKALRALFLVVCAVAATPALVAANAAEPSTQPITLYDAAGQPVAVLTPIHGGTRGGSPVWNLLRQADAVPAMPIADRFAQMDEMMNAMMARMNTLAAMPFTSAQDGTVDVALPQRQGSGQMLISTFSLGSHGSCTETMTYRMDDPSVQPQVAVRRVGDACGRVVTPDTRARPAAMPDQPDAAPASDQKLYKIDYRHKASVHRPLHG